MLCTLQSEKLNYLIHWDWFTANYYPREFWTLFIDYLFRENSNVIDKFNPKILFSVDFIVFSLSSYVNLLTINQSYPFITMKMKTTKFSNLFSFRHVHRNWAIKIRIACWKVTFKVWLIIKPYSIFVQSRRLSHRKRARCHQTK